MAKLTIKIDAILDQGKVEQLLLSNDWLKCTHEETGEFLHEIRNDDKAWWKPDGHYEDGSVSHAFACWEWNWEDAFQEYLDTKTVDEQLSLIQQTRRT